MRSDNVSSSSLETKNINKVGVRYIKVQHLYRVLIPPGHVLLSFCVE